MSKGRPPFEPRIAALELRTKLLETELKALLARILVLEHRQGVPAPPAPYEPQFDHWPNASGR